MATYEQISAQLSSQFGAKMLPEIWSKEIELYASTSQFIRFRDFVVSKSELTAQIGDKIYINKFQRMRGDGAWAMSESATLAGSGARVEASAYLTLQPTEYATELQFTQYGRYTVLALEEILKELMADEALKTENKLISEIAFGNSANRIFSNGAANRGAINASVTLSDVDTILEKLRVKNAPTFNGKYVALISPQQETNLRNALQNEFIDGSQQENLYEGSLGNYAGIDWRVVPGLHQQAFSAAGLVSAGSAGITIPDPAAYSLKQRLCEAEVLTFTYVAATDSWTVSGSVTGARKVALFTVGTDPNDIRVSPAVARASSYTDANAQTYQVALALEDEDGTLLGYDVILNAAAMSGAASDDTATLTVVVHDEILFMGQRHIGYAEIRPMGFLATKDFDYGRVLGLAMNGFMDCDFLFKQNGYVLECKR